MKHRQAAVTTTAIEAVMPTRQVGPIRALLDIHDLSIIYRESEASIRRKLQAGTFRPVPWDKYPYRWNPADVEKDLQTRRDLRMRNHGRFGEHRLKPAKVEAPANGRRHKKKKIAR